MRTGVQIPSNHVQVELQAFNPNADRNETGLGVLLECRCRRIVSFSFRERPCLEEIQQGVIEQDPDPFL